MSNHGERCIEANIIHVDHLFVVSIGVLRLSYPVHRSAVIDWPQYQCIWSAAERKVPLDSHDLVVAGCSDLLQDRAKLTSFLFDDFNVSSMRCVQSVSLTRPCIMFALSYRSLLHTVGMRHARPA